MLHFIRNSIFVLVIFLPFSVFAEDNYYADYYEDQESILFKVRGSYLNTSASVKNAPRNYEAEKPGKLVGVGYGFDTATTFFFTDSIAGELSLGLHYFKTKQTAFDKAVSAYGSGTNKYKKKNIYSFPLAGILQYHIAPYGAIRPYVGAGYHGAYLHTTSKTLKVRPGHGPVIQFGIDFMAKDSTFVTFDVRKFFLKSKATFSNNFLSQGGTRQSSMNSTLDLSPLVISIGIGFKL